MTDENRDVFDRLKEISVGAYKRGFDAGVVFAKEEFVNQVQWIYKNSEGDTEAAHYVQRLCNHFRKKS